MPDSAFPPNHRILVMNNNRAIHQDFRKILCGRGEHKGVEQAKAALFGEETNTPAPETFEVESAYQGQEGLAALRRAIEASRPFAFALLDVRAHAARLGRHRNGRPPVGGQSGHRDHPLHGLLGLLLGRDGQAHGHFGSAGHPQEAF